jgi:hypothetical protein
MRDKFSEGFAAIVNDIRQRVLEEGWFGKAVTPRRQTISIGSPGEESPGEKLGWFRRDAGERSPANPDLGRAEPDKEAKAPERGIDL